MLENTDNNNPIWCYHTLFFICKQRHLTARKYTKNTCQLRSRPFLLKCIAIHWKIWDISKAFCYFSNPKERSYASGSQFCLNWSLSSIIGQCKMDSSSGQNSIKPQEIGGPPRGCSIAKFTFFCSVRWRFWTKMGGLFWLVCRDQIEGQFRQIMENSFVSLTIEGGEARADQKLVKNLVYPNWFDCYFSQNDSQSLWPSFWLNTLTEDAEKSWLFHLAVVKRFLWRFQFKRLQNPGIIEFCTFCSNLISSFLQGSFFYISILWKSGTTDLLRIFCALQSLSYRLTFFANLDNLVLHLSAVF